MDAKNYTQFWADSQDEKFPFLLNIFLIFLFFLNKSFF